MILSSFYFGYALAHFPGGLLADWLGGKAVIVTALISTGLITMTIPTVVGAAGAYGLIVVRLLMGLMQGGIFPAINTMLSAWVPAHERGRMASLVFCGYPVCRIHAIRIPALNTHNVTKIGFGIFWFFLHSWAQPSAHSSRASFCIIIIPIGKLCSTTLR